MLNKLIDEAIGVIPMDKVMNWLAQVARFDRYQASHGIAAAAETVAAAARELGLRDVTVHCFPADGKTEFGTFRAPVSWTPTRAWAEIRCGDRTLLRLDHEQQPFLLATYSAPTPIGDTDAPLVTAEAPSAQLRGAVIVMRADQYSEAGLCRLEQAGAIGFITDAHCRTLDNGAQFSGRIELDATTSLFGFSVTSAQLQRVAALATMGARAAVCVAIDREASMPAVTAVLPADTEAPANLEEIWLTAHLCHPRPGANDNASGVAALLGVAATLMALAERSEVWSSRRRPVRFVWAPEFVGTAAVLQSTLMGNYETRPHSVLNLDMVGEDQTLCECPFIVERSPQNLSTLMVPVAEKTVEAVFAHTSADPGCWRPVPFLGYSDHALFAGPHMACSAVQFTHWPDRFNHSAADTLDKVSVLEMRRSITAAAMLTHVLANDYALIAGDIPALVQDWCLQEEVRAERAASEVGALAPWTKQLLAQVRSDNARLQALVLDVGAQPPPRRSRTVRTVHARWVGPLNLRAMMACLTPARRAALTSLVRADKFVLALLTNFAVRVDGQTTQDAIIQQTEYALRRPIDRSLACDLFSALFESGWVDNGIANPTPAKETP